jgi:hypothetical protein
MTILTPQDLNGSPLTFDKSNALWVKMNKARARVAAEICYCSTLGECWTLHGSMANASTTTETRGCPGPSATTFQQ